MTRICWWQGRMPFNPPRRCVGPGDDRSSYCPLSGRTRDSTSLRWPVRLIFWSTCYWQSNCDRLSLPLVSSSNFNCCPSKSLCQVSTTIPTTRTHVYTYIQSSSTLISECVCVCFWSITEYNITGSSRREISGRGREAKDRSSKVKRRQFESPARFQDKRRSFVCMSRLLFFLSLSI